MVFSDLQMFFTWQLPFARIQWPRWVSVGTASSWMTVLYNWTAFSWLEPYAFAPRRCQEFLHWLMSAWSLTRQRVCILSGHLKFWLSCPHSIVVYFFCTSERAFPCRLASKNQHVWGWKRENEITFRGLDHSKGVGDAQISFWAFEFEWSFWSTSDKPCFQTFLTSSNLNFIFR